MGIDFDIQGIDKLLTELERKDEILNSGMNKVLKESAEPLKERIESNVNLGPGKHDGHAKHDVVIGSIKHDGFEKQVPVGFTKDSYWYMWFLEKGTYTKGNPKGIKPQHNVERAMISSKYLVAKKQYYGLKRLLGGE